MQTYPLIGIAGNHRQDNTEEDRYILSYAPHGFVRGLEKAKAIPVMQKNLSLGLMDSY